jgi:hypothetical protein
MYRIKVKRLLILQYKETAGNERFLFFSIFIPDNENTNWKYTPYRLTRNWNPASEKSPSFGLVIIPVSGKS